MRLYTFVHSPNPLKVRLALAELGVSYEAVEVNLFRGEHRSDAFTRVNPHRKVPVLVDGDLVLRESNAILFHLGRSRGGAFWPMDRGAQGRVMQWLFFESAHMTMHCGTMWWTDFVAPAVSLKGADEGLVNEATRELERSLDLLEKELTGKSFLLGETMTIADCSVGVAVATLKKTRLDQVNRWPNVIAYRERLRSRPSWSEAKGEGIHVLA